MKKFFAVLAVVAIVFAVMPSEAQSRERCRCGVRQRLEDRPTPVKDLISRLQACRNN